MFPLICRWQTLWPMAKRKKERRPRAKAAIVAYTGPEGNILSLRESLSAGTIAKIGEAPASQAASVDDAWRRREEALFERLVVSWEIAGLPLESQKELLGRYRMASADERRWVRETLGEHLRTRHPDVTL